MPEKNGRKMYEKCPKKGRKNKRDETPISIDHTAHFSRKMVEKWHLIREETKRKWRFYNESTLGPSHRRARGHPLPLAPPPSPLSLSLSHLRTFSPEATSRVYAQEYSCAVCA